MSALKGIRESRHLLITKINVFWNKMNWRQCDLNQGIWIILKILHAHGYAQLISYIRSYVLRSLWISSILSLNAQLNYLNNRTSLPFSPQIFDSNWWFVRISCINIIWSQKILLGVKTYFSKKKTTNKIAKRMDLHIT